MPCPKTIDFDESFGNNSLEENWVPNYLTVRLGLHPPDIIIFVVGYHGSLSERLGRQQHSVVTVDWAQLRALL